MLWKVKDWLFDCVKDYIISLIIKATFDTNIASLSGLILIAI
jgi:hypothetical protein